jgi:hypothetical protein
MVERPQHAGGAEVEAGRRLARAIVERMGRPEGVGIERVERVIDDLPDRRARGFGVPGFS